MADDPTKLERFGYGEPFASAWDRLRRSHAKPATLDVARVIARHKGGLVLVTRREELLASIPGRMRKEIQAGHAPEPAVGDWVVVAPRWAERTASLQVVLPRRSFLSRKAAGEHATEQAIASNVDQVFIVTAMQQDFNPRRLERYLAVVRESGAQPVFVLTKADLCANVTAVRDAARAVDASVPVHVVSVVSGQGLAELDTRLVPSQTIALVGSSGVGKSTLINRWLGGGDIAVQTVRDDGRGRHTTTHRELTALPGGALVIDTPGMRELGMFEADNGVRQSFPDIDELGGYCRFTDCQHLSEPGCAVRVAVERGHLASERFASYQKLMRELEAVQRAKDPASAQRHKREVKATTKTHKREIRRRGR